MDGSKQCCYNCEKRYPGCHSKCKKYNDYKRKHEEEKAKELKGRLKLYGY